MLYTVQEQMLYTVQEQMLYTVQQQMLYTVQEQEQGHESAVFLDLYLLFYLVQ